MARKRSSTAEAPSHPSTAPPRLVRLRPPSPTPPAGTGRAPPSARSRIGAMTTGNSAASPVASALVSSSTPSAGHERQRPPQGLARAPEEVQRVEHVLVGETALLGQALGRQQIPQPLAGGGLGGELGDLHVALAAQAAQVEVHETERDPHPLGQRALAERPALADRGQDLQLAGVVPVHPLSARSRAAGARRGRGGRCRPPGGSRCPASARPPPAPRTDRRCR